MRVPFLLYLIGIGTDEACSRCIDKIVEGLHMLPMLQIVITLIVALAMVPAVAHALEMPGKRRLPKEQYLTVQRIYYPGFTFVGGFAELASVLGTLALVFLTERGTLQFDLTLGAFLALALMHAIFWIFTQPANKTWMREENLGAAGSAFFRTQDAPATSDWTALRHRWEYSHLARAVLAYAAVAMLIGAVAVS